MRNRALSLTELPDVLFKMRPFVLRFQVASRGGNHGWTRIDTDEAAITRQTKGPETDEVPRRVCPWKARKTRKIQTLAAARAPVAAAASRGLLIVPVPRISHVSLVFQNRAAGDFSPNGADDGEFIHRADGPVRCDHVLVEGRLEC